MDQTVLVTGGTGGIGFEVARAFALARARVLLLSRKGENGEEAAAKIQESVSQENNGEKADLEFISCDLGNLRMVQEVADRIRNKEDRLDIVSFDRLRSRLLTILSLLSHFSLSTVREWASTNMTCPPTG